MIVTDKPLEWSEELAQRIIEHLEKQRAVQPCPRCHNPRFVLVQGFVNMQIQRTLSTALTIGEGLMPCAATVCVRCGHVVFHSLGALGVLPG
jgi:hypothetical protein